MVSSTFESLTEVWVKLCFAGQKIWLITAICDAVAGITAAVITSFNNTHFIVFVVLFCLLLFRIFGLLLLLLFKTFQNWRLYCTKEIPTCRYFSILLRLALLGF
jgi:chromate transport protein ChrA